MVERTDHDTLQGIVAAQTCENAIVYTDGEARYVGLPHHGVVNHRIGEYVLGEAHTNGIEAFWALFKRAYKGVYHQMSPQHLRRYVTEFAGRYNQRLLAPLARMAAIVRGLDQKRLTYADLVGRHGNAERSPWSWRPPRVPRPPARPRLACPRCRPQNVQRPERPCACGCGRVLAPGGKAIYASGACRIRSWRAARLGVGRSAETQES